MRSLPALAVLAVATALPAMPQSPDTAAPPSTTQLFVPDTLVPLSQFAHKDVLAPLTLTVDPEILGWIKDKAAALGHDPHDHLFVAVDANGSTISYQAPDNWIQNANGAVTLSSNAAGDCVVVSDFLLHDPAIVTHWNAAANGGRGGQMIGARDGLLVWDYVFDASTKTHRLLPALGPNGSITNANPAWGSPPGNPSPQPYTYASDLIALFSDGSLANENAAIPGYERYIGESWALGSYTQLAAIWLSDRARQLTGFPIAHHSYPTAFPGFGPAQVRPGQRVEDDLPVFQVVHAHLVTVEEGPGSPLGFERSLATFILPPRWTSQGPPAAYPVLFNGFYDINDNTFQGEGVRFVQTLARLRAQVPSRTVVGLLWNGGGAGACQTFQRSAYDGAAKLFDDAAALLRADKQLMVFTGASRGGTTALAIASNPYRNTIPGRYDYRAVFVDVRAPKVLEGTTVSTFTTPSYPDVLAAVDTFTGYQGSWKSSWREPPALEQGWKSTLLRTFFGTTSPTLVDQSLSIDSAPFRRGLREAGTGVVLRIGTNDSNGPSTLLASYANHLRAEEPVPVPVLCQMFYRFGHAVPDVQPDVATLVEMAILGVPLADADQYYATDPDDYRVPRRITPSHVPLAVELPATVGATQAHTWAFVGEPGARVRVRVRPVTGTPCFSQPYSVGPQQSFTVTLSANPRDRFGIASVDPSALLQPLTAGPWWYEVDYDFDADGVFDRTLGYGDVALPGIDVPEFCVEPAETQGVAYALRTNGVAEDQRFLRGLAPIVPQPIGEQRTYRTK